MRVSCKLMRIAFVHHYDFCPMLLVQSVPNHILVTPASSKAASAQQVNQLEGQLERERRQVETLETKHRTLLSQLEVVTSHETQLREEVTMLEKNLTILKHDLKEVNFWICFTLK